MFKIQSRKKSKKLNSQKASKKPQDFFRARLIYRIEVVFFKLRSCDQSDLFGREFFSLSIPWKLRSLGPGILLGINCEVLTKKKKKKIAEEFPRNGSVWIAYQHRLDWFCLSNSNRFQVERKIGIFRSARDLGRKTNFGGAMTCCLPVLSTQKDID